MSSIGELYRPPGDAAGRIQGVETLAISWQDDVNLGSTTASTSIDLFFLAGQGASRHHERVSKSIPLLYEAADLRALTMTARAVPGGSLVGRA